MTPPAESLLGDRLRLYRAHYAPDAADAIYATLHAETAWLRRGYDNADGGVTHLPRLTANYGERSYDYARLEFTPVPWTPLLRELKAAAERLGEEVFNAAILQLYRDGADRVNWHADDSPAVGVDPVIVSLSFGAARTFQVRHKTSGERMEMRLAHGDLLVMRGDLQHHYLHRIPKESGAGPRINVTFRCIRV